MSRVTSLFGLEIPKAGSINWGSQVTRFFEQMEEQLGCNSNLAMISDTAHGIGYAGQLAQLSSADGAVKADPSAGRWGRTVAQTTMVNGQQQLYRLLGITQIRGATGASLYDTLYHDADSADLTNDIDAALVADSTSIKFLPMGFAFNGGEFGLFSGVEPLVVCPNIPTGQFTQYKPGVNDPSGSFATVFDSGPALSITLDASGSQQYIDLIAMFAIPGNFLGWSAIDSANIWAARTLFKTTGDGQVSVQSVIDSAGSEHAITGVSGTSVGSYGTLALRQKKVRDAAGTWTPGGTAALRLRCQGSSSAVIRVRPTALTCYLPEVTWQA